MPSGSRKCVGVSLETVPGPLERRSDIPNYWTELTRTFFVLFCVVQDRSSRMFHRSDCSSELCQQRTQDRERSKTYIETDIQAGPAAKLSIVDEIISHEDMGILESRRDSCHELMKSSLVGHVAPRDLASFCNVR